jgi:hypothetical protein
MPGRGRLFIQESTSDANQAIRPGPMRRRAGKRLRATYLLIDARDSPVFWETVLILQNSSSLPRCSAGIVAGTGLPEGVVVGSLDAMCGCSELSIARGYAL